MFHAFFKESDEGLMIPMAILRAELFNEDVFGRVVDFLNDYGRCG